MKNERGTIIFGASGRVGKPLYNLFKEKNKPVVGTYCKNKKQDLIYFDITKSSIYDLPYKRAGYGIICSAITNLDQCKENPEYSYKVNVEGIEKIIIDLSNEQIIPIFISSGAVFDGVVGGYGEESIRNPLSAYGEQKVEVEDFITENIKNYLIVRPGKVCNFKELTSNWLKKYNAGETILCADDEQLSLTSAKDVAEGIDLLIENDSRGIYHLNSPIHCSRLDLLNQFFRKLEITDAKIKSCSIDDFGNEKRAKKSFMDASKFINETGFEFIDANQIIDDYK
jgi:dTDP-4-dehydrorhamnose reductase